MKITLAKSAGFCFGVRRAITIALNTAAKNSNVRMCGDIVHNEDVIASIEKAGVRRVRHLRKNPGHCLLIRAHGAASAFISRARRFGYKIIDATCPMVKDIHKIARRMEKQGRRIIIIGDKEHDEVKGILGQLKTGGIVIESRRGISGRLKSVKKAAVVVQSTQNEEKVNAILRGISSIVPDLKFFNTVCSPTRLKQTEIRCLPLLNEAIVVIGSKGSANTRRLFEISKKINRRTYWVESEKDIRPQWFRAISSVGITAGASTPDETTQGVIRFLKGLRA
ncbi:MAG: 4-hydroxy-3-methylbut-2-enyl diphosphate reductase [Candidatus Omnitrophota bacterium]